MPSFMHLVNPGSVECGLASHSQEPSSANVRQLEIVKIGDCLLGYKAMQKKIRRSPWNHFLGRMREIEKIIKHRHGSYLPNTDDAFIYVQAIADLALVQYGEGFVDIVHAWCTRWLPWAAKADLDVIIYEKTKVRYSPLTADALGHLLHVSYSERLLLDLRTIGAHDVCKRQRAKIQKSKTRQRDRERKAAERRTQGAVPRSEYLAASVTKGRPWESFGCSRRTWERRGKPEPSHMSGTEMENLPLG